jgi:single-strand DNA-binding protein
MNNIRNNVQLIGHLGRNPEVKNLDNGNKVAKLILATNETRTNPNGEKITNTQWHTLTAWNGHASLAEKYLIKGKQIMVVGKLNNTNFIDKQGIKHFKTEIIVNEIKMIA